ncbi:hypothetical protein VKT23_015317 [Stygiomarasmius scandens]|uniref:Uncharacterized protein n=1 Tax=Marasmiellus scandens TaxID=2682957 RepID=A0ABR1J2J5_9AGAR
MPPKPNKQTFTDAEAERAFPEVPLPDANSKSYPKRTPRRQIFNATQDAWIQMQTSQFQVILDDTKCNASDRDEREAMFKRAKILQFERRFSDTERPDAYMRLKLSKKITQIFANIKSRNKFGSSGASDDAPPFPSYMLVSGKLGASSGYSLFAERNREAVNKEVLEHRRVNNIDNQQHPALLRSFSSRAWARLSPDEQGQYVAEATAMKREQGASDDIYQNQIETMAFLQCLLQRSIGHGRGQIGNASFHVFMAYRDSNDRVEPLILNAGPSFEEFLGREESKALEDRWTLFVERNVLPNRPVLQEREFGCNEAGRYLFVASETFSKTNGGGHNAYLEYLKRFLDATWAFDFARSSKLPSMPWELITQSPADYLHPDLCDGKSLANLDTSHARLYSFADLIVQFQSTHPMDSIFVPRAASTAANNLNLAGNPASPGNSSLETTNASSTPPLPSISLEPASPAVGSGAVAESSRVAHDASLDMMLSPSPPPSLLLSPTDHIGTVMDVADFPEPSVSTTGAEEPLRPEISSNGISALKADSTSELVGSAGYGSKPAVAARRGRPSKRKRDESDVTSDNVIDASDKTTAGRAKRSAKSRQMSHKEASEEAGDEVAGAARRSVRRRIVKDPNADNKHTGSPAYKKKKA